MTLPKKLILAIWLPAALLVAWQLLSAKGLLDPLFFPPPSSLLAEGRGLLASGLLLKHAKITMSRALGGFAWGACAGLALGLLMGASSRARRSIDPLLSAFYATPKLSLFPLLMLFLGVGDAAKVALIGISTFILVAFHAVDAVLNIPAVYVELARNYGAGHLALLRHVYLPACLPQVFTGLRLAMGRALVGAISVELVSSQDGLGALIWISWQTMATERLFVAILATAALGVTLHTVLRKLEARLIVWRPRHVRA